MTLRTIHPESEDYKKMVALRMEILRKPLGLEFSSFELEKEKNDLLIGAFENDELMGCCILTEISKDVIKLRQMAVLQNKQNQNIGSSILAYAEALALKAGYTHISMHARESAILFYKKSGYKIKGESFVEVTLTHYLMEKIL